MGTNRLREEGGFSLVKLLIGLVIAAIVLYVGIRYILVRVHYLSVEDAVIVQTANASMYNDDYLRAEIIAKAMDAKVPLVEEDIIIERIPGKTATISVSYRDSLPLFVKTIYFDFDIEKTAPLTR